MHKTTAALLLSFSPFWGIKAQEIYLSQWGRIDQINIETLERSTLCQLSNGAYFADIALDQQGNFYGLEKSELYRVDVNTGIATLVNANLTGAGMVADADGILYLAAFNLLRFDPATGIVENLGPLNHTCAGDLAFWNGELYMTSSDQNIIKVNIQHPDQSEIYMNLNQSPLGLTTVWDCASGKARIFAFGNSDELEIDLANKKFWKLSDKPSDAWGATSPSEWHGSKSFYQALDTIYRFAPDCGEANGSIELIPSTGELGMLEFSLDGLVWQTNGLFEDLRAGAYTIQIRGGSCQNAMVRIALDAINATPVSAYATAPALCHQATGEIIVQPNDNTPGLVYAVDGSSLQPDNRFAGLLPGWHTVTATGPGGCQSFAYAFIQDSITSYLNGVIREPDTFLVCRRSGIKLLAIGPPNSLYTWSENEQVLAGEVSASLLLPPRAETGNYAYGVTVTDAYGCTATEFPTELYVYNCAILPNTFTPDNDGVNDVFGFIKNEFGSEYTLIVYNRWGQEVFHSTPAIPHWDGTIQGELCPMDVYLYRINLTLFDGSQQEWTGDVTLLR